jgi:hypothetical protein
MRERRRPAIGRLRMFVVLTMTITVVTVLSSAYSPSAHAVIFKTFTWTGKGAKTGDTDWSDGANWKHGKAPTVADGAVILDFPSFLCTKSKPSCNVSTDDLDGLGVLTINFAGTTARKEQSLDIAGGPIPLYNSITGTTNKVNGASPFLTLSAPIELEGNQTWTMNGAALDLEGTVSGDFDLTLDFQAQTVAFVDSSGNDVSSLIVTGAGQFWLDQGASFNSGGNPVEVSDGAFLEAFESGAAIGSLTSSGGAILVYGGLQVNGAAAFDSASDDDVQLDSDSDPELQATGAATLASMGVNLSAECSQPTGTAFTLFDAAGGISGQLTQGSSMPDPGAVISNDTTIEAPTEGGGGCTSGSPSYFQFSYGVDTVTATVVAPPT